MKGAERFCEVFKHPEQIGQLFMLPDYHARGRTFRVFVLPKGAIVENNNPFKNKDAVEVYGILRGTTGWSEEYGWKYEGKWCDDLMKIVEEREKAAREKAEKKRLEKLARKEKEKQKEKERIAKLLAMYD